MEYVEGGNLLEVIINYSFGEDMVKFFAAQLVYAIHELHDQNYVHRDLKTENIMVDKKGYIKLIDFGISKMITRDEKV